MTQFKGKGSNSKAKEEEIDFNNAESFSKIVNEISKDKLKNSKSISDVPKKIIAFLTSNVKVVAIIAGYFILSGIVLNIYGIYRLIKMLCQIM